MLGGLSLSARRAWIEIIKFVNLRVVDGSSLSARRAWIEISGGACARLSALSSLSARRAWIEIDAPSSAPYAELVALRKESVDRNQQLVDTSKDIISRSPQGERG